jgi:hypothetical protein
VLESGHIGIMKYVRAIDGIGRNKCVGDEAKKYNNLQL